MNTIGFEYKFTNLYEIFSALTLNGSELFVYLPAIVLTIIWTHFLVYKYIPMLYVYIDYRKLEKNKLKKKQFIIRIKLQNEIEDEVEKELK